MTDDSELDAIFIPTKRAVFWPWLLAVALIVGGGVVVFKLVTDDGKDSGPAIDAKVASDARDVLPLIESKVPSERGPWIAALLVDLLGDRVPGGVRSGLRQVQEVPPEYQQVMWAKTLTQKSVRKLWRHVCRQGGSVFAEIMQEGRKDGGVVMYQRCKFHRMELLDVNRALESGAAQILLAHAIYKHLDEQGTLTALDIRALQLLARSSNDTGSQPMRMPTASTTLPARRFDLPSPPELIEPMEEPPPPRKRDYLDEALDE